MMWLLILSGGWAVLTWVVLYGWHRAHVLARREPPTTAADWARAYGHPTRIEE